MSSGHSTSEVGHEKNVANLLVMIKALQLFPDYNPVNPKIFLPALQDKYNQCLEQLEKVDDVITKDDNAVNARQYAFEKLGTLTTRVFNAADYISEDPKLMDDISK